MNSKIIDKIKNVITVFLLQLVLTLPFYTTSVYATINDISVKGSDGIERFAKWEVITTKQSLLLGRSK